jgi:hypothetical protein
MRRHKLLPDVDVIKLFSFVTDAPLQINEIGCFSLEALIA